MMLTPSVRRKLKGKSFTVIGANSYIARHIVSTLKALECKCFLYDLQQNSIDHHEHYASVDIREPASVEKINFRSDYTFVFSGLTGTTAGFEKYADFIDVNEKGLLNILSAMRKTKSKSRIIFPSTRLVYKGKKNIPVREDGELAFKTIYSLNKFFCENILHIYHNCFGMTYSIFRICVPYGNKIDGKTSYGTLGHFLSQAAEKKDIVIFGSGLQKRSFIHIEDLINILLSAILSGKSRNRILNIGGPDTLSISNVAKAIARIYGVRVIHSPWPPLSLETESGDTIFDSSAIEQMTRYSYGYRFRDWVKEQKRILEEYSGK